MESADLPEKERRVAGKGISGESTVILATSNSSFHRSLFFKKKKLFKNIITQNKTTKSLNFLPWFRRLFLENP